jgi:hypothetical protein
VQATGLFYRKRANTPGRLAYVTLKAAMPLADRIRRFRRPALALVAVAGFAVSIAFAAPPAQQSNSSSSEQVVELVATLATGRATIISGRDGLVIATVGSAFEPDSLPPLIVPLGESAVAIVFGADDWQEPPPTNRTLLRLDQELPGLMHTAAAGSPSLTPSANFSQLDQVALGALEPLRTAARNLHEQLHLPDNLPLAEIVLIRRTEDAQLVVWDISYWIHQTFWQENFWDTEVQRPRTMQIYPTKQDRSGILQVSYPPGGNAPGLLEWLSQPTGGLAQAIGNDPKLASAQKNIAHGKTGKIHMTELVPLVKTALETMVPTADLKAMAVIGDETGFSWMIQPAVSRAPVVKRPSSAPTLEGPGARE